MDSQPGLDYYLKHTFGLIRVGALRDKEREFWKLFLKDDFQTLLTLEMFPVDGRNIGIYLEYYRIFLSFCLFPGLCFPLRAFRFFAVN